MSENKINVEVILPNALTPEQKIRAEQVKRGYLDEAQLQIDSGSVFDGSLEKAELAEGWLKEGICFLPNRVTGTYYGNPVPSRNQLAPGSIGTLEYAAKQFGINLNN